jgi:hypothetical protein
MAVESADQRLDLLAFIHPLRLPFAPAVRAMLAIRQPPATLRPMPPDAELAHLRQEVATLRQQMKDLFHFISIEKEKGAEVPRNLILRCGIIMVQNPHEPHATQIYMGGSENGPFVSLWDSHQKGRVILSVEKDVPTVTLYTGELKEAVLLRADPIDGLGLVAAFDNGKPRALIKAGEGDSGSISVVHDDGRSRITMHGTEDSACLMAVNADLQAAVKISSDGPNGGGLVVVNNPMGKPLAFMSSGPMGGAVIVNGPDGQPAASLPDAGFDRKKREE